MPLHLVAYAKSITTNGTLQAITPVPDSTVTEANNDLYVPDKYNQIAAVYGLTKGAQAFSKAQLQSPSLRELYYPDVRRLVLGASGTNYNPPDNYFDEPYPLQTNEGLQFWSDGGGNGTTAQDAYGLVWLTDAKVAPASGQRLRIRATAGITLAARTWVNGALTFDQVLPVGNYDIVGMRAIGANLVASRLVFIGASAVTRPGVAAQASEQQVGSDMFEMGNAGVLGTFNSVTPPSVDCLGDTDTSQVFYFELIKK